MNPTKASIVLLFLTAFLSVLSVVKTLHLTFFNRIVAELHIELDSIKVKLRNNQLSRWLRTAIEAITVWAITVWFFYTQTHLIHNVGLAFLDGSTLDLWDRATRSSFPIFTEDFLVLPTSMFIRLVIHLYVLSWIGC
jgi:hypothetical protein